MAMATNVTASFPQDEGSGGKSVAMWGITIGVGIMLMLYYSIVVAGDGLDPKEPPIVRAKIPFIGHIIGMWRHQTHYLENLSINSNLPIITMKIFSSRVYIISSPDLVQSALRNSKSLAFEPFIIETVGRVFDIEERGMAILRYSDPNGDNDYMSDIHKSMSASLTPGPALLEMNARALETLAGILNNIGVEEQEKGLYRWIRDSFTEASAEALYGPENPVIWDKSLIQSLWDFAGDINILFLNILPQYTARKAYKGRLALRKAFQKYYEDGRDVDAAGLVKERAINARKWGFIDRDLGAFENSILFVATTNTVPTGFWLACYILSDNKLLAEIRAEIRSIVARTVVDGKETLSMDISRFQKNCPLLVSAYQEAFRLIASSSSVRMVMQDMLLDDTYLLKKGSTIQMPSGINHQSSSIWGPDSCEFDAYRFLPQNKDAFPKEQKKKQTQGYVPFGGGKHLCPGRHFAFTEIMGLIATLLYGFDIKMKGRSEGISVPKMGQQKFGTGIRKPVNDIDVLVRRKKEFEGVVWRYDLGGGV
jgi:cytochrome P450